MLMEKGLKKMKSKTAVAYVVKLKALTESLLFWGALLIIISIFTSLVDSTGKTYQRFSTLPFFNPSPLLLSFYIFAWGGTSYCYIRRISRILKDEEKEKLQIVKNNKE